MDAAHTRLGKCPSSVRNNGIGKEGYPTLVFQAVCPSSQMSPKISLVLIKKRHHIITITNNDELPLKIENGLMKDVKAFCMTNTMFPSLFKEVTSLLTVAI